MSLQTTLSKVKELDMQRPRRLVEAVKLLQDTLDNSLLYTKLEVPSSNKDTEERKVRCPWEDQDKISTKCSRSERELDLNSATEHLP
jgi:hypothetical protein